MILENQTNEAKVRKCVWEDENKDVKVSEVMPGSDPWRLAASSLKRNYAVGKECPSCQFSVRCKKECWFQKYFGGYVEE